MSLNSDVPELLSRDIMDNTVSTLSNLHKACCRGDLRKVKRLLQPADRSDSDVRNLIHGYRASGLDSSKWGTPLEIAAFRSFECADYLLAVILDSHLYWLSEMRGRSRPYGEKSEHPSKWLLMLLDEAGIWPDMDFVRHWSERVPGSQTLLAALALGLSEVAKRLVDAVLQGLAKPKGAASSGHLGGEMMQRVVMGFASYSRDCKAVRAALLLFGDQGQPATSVLQEGCVGLLRGWPWNLHRVPTCLEVHDRFSEVSGQMEPETVRESLTQAIQWSRLQTRHNIVLLLPQSLPTMATTKKALQDVSKIFAK